jgi:UDP-N-acetylmuramoylalanine--D-glutamate ligase
MQEAVEKAYGAAVEGDTVLLSPACASFDMFDSYAHRGKHFREIVERLR